MPYCVDVSVESPYFLVNITNATSSEAYAKQFRVEYSYDGNGRTLFHSREKNGSWAEYELEPDQVNVTLVRLQNRHNCCC